MKIDIKYNDISLTYDDFMAIDKECFPNEYFSNLQFEDMKQSDFWVVYINGQPVGYMSVKIYPNDIHLSRIGVGKKARNTKVASKLMDTLVNFSNSKEKSCISLLVETTNNKAISLYEKYGFSSVGTKCQFVIPIKKLLLDNYGSNTSVSSISIDESNCIVHKHELKFVDSNNDIIGKCFLDSEFPGCSYYEIDNPDINFIDSLISLRRFLNIEKDILTLTIDQKSLINTCIKLDLKLNYELIKMQRCLL